jgi:excisionase family DNA binding protein
MAGSVYAEPMKTMTVSEAAAELGLSSDTLRHQIRNGRLKATRIGPLWVVSPQEVARYRLQSLGHSGRPFVVRKAPPSGKPLRRMIEALTEAHGPISGLSPARREPKPPVEEVEPDQEMVAEMNRQVGRQTGVPTPDM